MLRNAVILAAMGTAVAQIYPHGPQVLTFLSDIDDSDQPYALYLPKKLAPGKKYPLVISLHGAWSNHRLNLRRVFGKGNLPGETDAEARVTSPPCATWISSSRRLTRAAPWVTRASPRRTSTTFWRT